MKPTPRTIGKVITILAQQIAHYENPVVTEIAEQTKQDPFKVLISCLISLRTRDEVTVQASAHLFKLADTVKKMAKLSEKQIAKAIYPTGFYITKAKRIREISKMLIAEYGGKVPLQFDQLMALKGVGRKTANIVMIYGHGSESHIAVDVHCHRIPNRLGWVKTNIPEETEHALLEIVPKRYWHDLNNTFVAFGQNICVPISPKCSLCPIERYCAKVGVTKHR
ncbi:MAG TPA: endonuclease III [Candidatus Nanoarchaeia archaeon]|nr:endonuclease III [Candidatus Nanoarchaeia archaeon]